MTRRISSEQREAIRICLAEIERDGNGKLTPEAVVEAAKDADSPLHDQFTWDVEAAAHEHWLDQARALIVSVRYIVKNEHSTINAVYYHRDPNAASHEQGYVSVPTLQTDEDMARAALVEAFRRVGDELRRAQQLAIVLAFDKEVEELLNGVVELRQRIAQAPTALM